MKRRRLFIIIVASLFAVVLAVILWPSEREPEYNGVALSTWLERAGRGPTEEFADAVKHISTNGLPCLVRAVEYQPPRRAYWLAVKVSRLPPSLSNSRFANWLLDDKRLLRAQGAVVAFGILQRDALPALADLQRIANTRSSPYAIHAIMALTSNPDYFGPIRGRQPVNR
jgi:hypothetical protein